MRRRMLGEEGNLRNRFRNESGYGVMIGRGRRFGYRTHRSSNYYEYSKESFENLLTVSLSAEKS
jgi:hypothetical protein